jgi:hypothetical protein
MWIFQLIKLGLLKRVMNIFVENLTSQDSKKDALNRQLKSNFKLNSNETF